MEIALASTLPETLPVPLYAAVPIGTAKNNGQEFDIFIGLNEALATRLRMLSLNKDDEALQENTSDYERFGTGSYEAWYSKNRVPFALVDKASGGLAALIWFGPKPLGRKSLKHLSTEELLEEHSITSDNWHTIVFRSYPPFRGGGIMTDFARAVTDVYLKYFPDAKLWAGVGRRNAPSVALAEKLGYSIDETVSDDDWVALVRK